MSDVRRQVEAERMGMEAELKERDAKLIQQATAVAIEAAARECERHAAFCKSEAEKGGSWDHLMTRYTEATHNAQRIRALAPSGTANVEQLRVAELDVVALAQMVIDWSDGPLPGSNDRLDALLATCQGILRRDATANPIEREAVERARLEEVESLHAEYWKDCAGDGNYRFEKMLLDRLMWLRAAAPKSEDAK